MPLSTAAASTPLACRMDYDCRPRPTPDESDRAGRLRELMLKVCPATRQYTSFRTIRNGRADSRPERTLLINAIGRWRAGSIEHIGSTATPGVAAKPVIDIMAGVESLEASRAALVVLERDQYCYAPYRTQVMHWLCKPSPALRTHHLHLVPLGSPLWIEQLAFRDYLRTHPEVALEYAALKRRLPKSTDLTETPIRPPRALLSKGNRGSLAGRALTDRL
jgi:hypothetical protein